MAGTLFVVATPIGHLEDITLRALAVLKSVAQVAAEDSRRTAKLLGHYDIKTPVLSLHEHNEQARVPLVLARLARGQSVALVTDAGTPGISDPGTRLVSAARAAGFRVEPVPGPSAVAAALSASGIDSTRFTFLGFPPIRSKDRKQWFDTLSRALTLGVVVFFEAPHRVRRTLGELDNLVKWPIVAAREITKLHEEFKTGTPAELAAFFETPKGEFTFVVPAEQAKPSQAEAPDDSAVVGVVGQITKSGGFSSKRKVAREAARRLGMTTKQVYAVLERTRIGQ